VTLPLNHCEGCPLRLLSGRCAGEQHVVALDQHVDVEAVLVDVRGPEHGATDPPPDHVGGDEDGFGERVGRPVRLRRCAAVHEPDCTSDPSCRQEPC